MLECLQDCDLDFIRYSILDEARLALGYKDSVHHGVEHFENVFKEAKYIRDKLGLSGDIYDDKILLICAYSHDLFSGVDRANHHTLAANWVLSNNLYLFTGMDNELRSIIASACGQHRKSGDGTYTHPLSELIAAADIGKPNLMQWLETAYNYALENNQVDENQAFIIALRHIRNKYGYHGYAKMPMMYQTTYGKGYHELQQLLSTI